MNSKNRRDFQSAIFLMKNRKGISSIIATLILLLLTIVLVGIVWAVVSGIVKTSTEGATSGAQCFNSGIDITSASCTEAGVCNVTVQRTLGTDVLGGVRLVFSNIIGSSNFTDVSGNLQNLVPLRTTFNTAVANVTKVVAAFYFVDEANIKSSPCPPVEFTAVQLV